MTMNPYKFQGSCAIADSHLPSPQGSRRTIKHHFIIINHECYCSSVCSELDLKEVVSRLRDWFRVLHENGNHKRVKISKPEKNSESRVINTVAVTPRHLAASTRSHFLSFSQQSLRSVRRRFVRTPWAGCSPGWTRTLTSSWTNQKSRASTWTGTSRAPMRSSNPVTHMPTKS